MKSSQVTIGILYALAACYAIEDQYWKPLHAVAFAVAAIGLFTCMVGLMVAGVQLGEFGVRWMRRKARGCR